MTTISHDANKRRALGRGLDALLPASSPPPGYADKSVFVCPLEKIVPQKGQPRQHFDDKALDELATSIREHGLIQPLAVRRIGGEDKFELIAGERRWRALQRAGLHEALVVVKETSIAAAFELALIENIQREDLNPLELAEALSRLIKEHGYTQEALAERVGKDRTTITNSLRLLKLPPRVRTHVIDGDLTEGHARALLGAPDSEAIEKLADKVLRGKLSVRATEALVRSNGTKAKPEAAAATTTQKSASIKDVEARLTKALGTTVELRDQGNRGEVVIAYADLDALDRLLERLEA